LAILEVFLGHVKSETAQLLHAWVHLLSFVVLLSDKKSLLKPEMW